MPGIHLTLMIGPTVAVPVPATTMESLQSLEVTHSDEGRSGFQITFRAGRTGPGALVDYPGLPVLKPFNRVIVIVTIAAVPTVLMDGVITHLQLDPGSDAGNASTLSVTGEDVSVMMDLEEKTAEHPAQDETVIAMKLIASYAQYGLIPTVIPPPVVDPPNPVDRVPVQQATDLEYLKLLARRHAYVFYVAPGPAPFANLAYWGPPKRTGAPQPALSVNLGPNSNVDSIHFSSNHLAPTLVAGKVQDRQSNQSTAVQVTSSSRPPLVSAPALVANQPNVRKTQFREDGLTSAQAIGRAQAITDASTDVVTAEGELDAARYGGLLQARGLVDLRGAGLAHSGTYYVKRVTHSLQLGTYKQRFTLTREGTGAMKPLVVP
jgi:hypothetical protein